MPRRFPHKSGQVHACECDARANAAVFIVFEVVCTHMQSKIYDDNLDAQEQHLSCRVLHGSDDGRSAAASELTFVQRVRDARSSPAALKVLPILDSHCPTARLLMMCALAMLITRAALATCGCV